ncbi:MAG: toll/interleukin-1 receptor domain-containing protein [Bacteroidota bacterium]
MKSDDYVFISYSGQNLKIVERLVEGLNKRGVRVWLDINEIKPGESYLTRLLKGIFDSSAIIYLVGNVSNRLSWINDAIYKDLRKGKLIIPVIVDEIAIRNTPHFIRHLKPLPLKDGFDLTLDRILEALKGKVTIGKPVEEVKKQSKGYVFISYAEQDSDFVSDLKEFLKTQGYAYWDYNESNRDYHSQIFLELEFIIKEAAATLSILSEDWKKSKWTVKEYFFSEEIGIPVFLLKAKKIGPTLAIAGIPFIDFVPDKKAGFDKLDRELKRKKL